MRYAGIENANPNNKKIMNVINLSGEHEPLNEAVTADADSNYEKDLTEINRPVILDLAKTALYLIEPSDKREHLSAHVILITNDGKYVINKGADSCFDAAIVKDIKVSGAEEVVSLPLIANDNVVDGLMELGVKEADIESVDLELLKDEDENLFYKAEVKVQSTEEEIIKKLSDNSDFDSNIHIDDITFKKRPASKKLPKKYLGIESEDSSAEKFVLAVSKYIKKICHIA